MNLDEVKEYQKVYHKKCKAHKKLLTEHYIHDVLSLFPKDFPKYQYLATTELNKHVEDCMMLYIKLNLSHINHVRGQLSIREYKHMEDSLKKSIESITKEYEIHSYSEFKKLEQALSVDSTILEICKDTLAGRCLISEIIHDKFFKKEFETDPLYVEDIRKFKEYNPTNLEIELKTNSSNANQEQD